MYFFSDLGFASVVKGGPDPNTVREDRKTLKRGGQQLHKFSKRFILVRCVFFVGLGGVSGSVFFCGLVAEAFQIEATSGHFSSYVAEHFGS